MNASESAGILWATIRPHVRPHDHSAEIAAMQAIQRHIEADRHECAKRIGREATSLMDSKSHHPARSTSGRTAGGAGEQSTTRRNER